VVWDVYITPGSQGFSLLSPTYNLKKQHLMETVSSNVFSRNQPQYDDYFMGILKTK
jgi:hypothetical protein